jgi:hypothetical protein
LCGGAAAGAHDTAACHHPAGKASLVFCGFGAGLEHIGHVASGSSSRGSRLRAEAQQQRGRNLHPHSLQQLGRLELDFVLAPGLVGRGRWCANCAAPEGHPVFGIKHLPGPRPRPRASAASMRRGSFVHGKAGAGPAPACWAPRRAPPCACVCVPRRGPGVLRRGTRFVRVCACLCCGVVRRRRWGPCQAAPRRPARLAGRRALQAGVCAPGGARRCAFEETQ